MTRINIDFSQHLQYLQYVSYSILLLQKHRVRMWELRGTKTNPRHKNSTAPGPRPRFEILDPPLIYLADQQTSGH